ncbi:MAG: ethylbenzene dehydrogenase-related protein [Planctomycetota bacterium]
MKKIMVALILLAGCNEAGTTETPQKPAVDKPAAGPAGKYVAKRVEADLSEVAQPGAGYWDDAPEMTIDLLAQMMVKPKPKVAETKCIHVKAVHDGNYIAFRLRWADTEKSEAGKLGTFSDAVALEFPVLDNDKPPPIFMGMKDNPVHLFHWRAQYQYDEEHGKKEIRDIYPNLSVDMYPNEFVDRGNLKPSTEDERKVFSPGKATGNLQSVRKRSVDEAMAEGFSTSVVREDNNSIAFGQWKDGEWVVVISRALKRPGGSSIEVGKGSSFGIAVWQGGKDEVGARKSISMLWWPFVVGKE